MRFKLWLETAVRSIPLTKLYGWRPKVLEVLQDIEKGDLSQTPGPITVSRYGRNFFVLDGHHRALEAILKNQRHIEITIDQFIPDVIRSGGAYSDILKDTIRLIDAI